jgi:hypothetical protein
MLNVSALGKLLVIAGIVLTIFGVVFMLGGKLSWFGKLPGDISIHKEGFSFYFPITTSIIISIILSVILFLINKR